MTDDLHTLLADLAGPPKQIEPGAVKARARRLEAARRRRRLAAGAAAAAIVVVGSIVALQPRRDPDQRVAATGSTEVPSSVVAPSGWRELAQLPANAMSEANTMQDDGRTLLWTGSLVVIPGLVEAITFDPATSSFGALPPAPVDLSSTRGSYRGNLPWIWTGNEILRIDPTPLPSDPSGGSGLGPLVGLAYSPAARAWRRMADAPVGHFNGIAWTGTELLAWSRDGVAAYHPETDGWELLTDQPGPASDASAETATWTGTELVAVGRGAVAAFDPNARTWRALSTPPGHTGATMPPSSTTGGIMRVQWTGREVIAYDADTGTIERLDPASDTWRTSPSNDLIGRQPTRSALWAGDRFVVWGGPVYSPNGNGTSLTGYARDGAAWDPTTDSWNPIGDLPTGMIPMSGILAGDRFIAVFQASEQSDANMVVLELHP
jgi:hypothetical protein